MAKIIYRRGFQGENKLECICGIEIKMFNGQKALIYPKYAEKCLLEREQTSRWGAPREMEIEALKGTENRPLTKELRNCGSPAAEFVCQFNKGQFALPTLVAALEIQHQRDDIDALAETIEGADLLSDFTSYVWSCSRSDNTSGWIAYGNGGFVADNDSCVSYLAVPTYVQPML